MYNAVLFVRLCILLDEGSLYGFFLEYGGLTLLPLKFSSFILENEIPDVHFRNLDWFILRVDGHDVV